MSAFIAHTYRPRPVLDRHQPPDPAREGLRAGIVAREESRKNLAETYAASGDETALVGLSEELRRDARRERTRRLDEATGIGLAEARPSTPSPRYGKTQAQADGFGGVQPPCGKCGSVAVRVDSADQDKGTCAGCGMVLRWNSAAGAMLPVLEVRLPEDPARRLPVVAAGGKNWYRDDRLQQYRHVDNPHEFLSHDEFAEKFPRAFAGPSRKVAEGGQLRPRRLPAEPTTPKWHQHFSPHSQCEVGTCPSCKKPVLWDEPDGPVWTCPADLAKDNPFHEKPDPRITSELQKQKGVFSNCGEHFGLPCHEMLPLHSACYNKGGY